MQLPKLGREARLPARKRDFHANYLTKRITRKFAIWSETITKIVAVPQFKRCEVCEIILGTWTIENR